MASRLDVDTVVLVIAVHTRCPLDVKSGDALLIARIRYCRRPKVTIYKSDQNENDKLLMAVNVDAIDPDLNLEKKKEGDARESPNILLCALVLIDYEYL